MATLQTQPKAVSPLQVWTVLADPAMRTAIAVSGVMLAVGSGLLLATSDHLVDPLAYGIQMTVLMIGAVAAALVWIKRRPGNRIAVYALAYALIAAVISLQGARNELLHSLGVLVEPVFFLLGYVLVFAFPAGKPIGLPERLILAAMSLYFVVGFVPWMFFSPVVMGGSPLSGCTDACPANALMIADRPEIAASFGTDLVWVVIAVLTATIVCLAVRMVQASRPRRRTLAPVYAIALLFTIPALAFHGFAAGVLHLDGDALSNAGWTLVVGRAALAYGLLLAILQASLFAGGALKRLIGQIGGHPNASRLREIVADALDDPSVELVFRVDGSDRFVDSRGEPLASARAGDGRATTVVDRDDETVAAIWHDPALNTDPELVRAACQAVQLALETGRLETELAESRANMVSAREAERRKVERDLHDGAQQKLVALQIKLALAAELAPSDSEIAARLAEVGYGLEDAVQELRDLAHGAHPPVLRDFGLRAALASAAQYSTPPAALVADGIARYPDEVETTVYYCCLESLQNVAKHAGSGAHASVLVAEQDGELRFEIADDGRGCEVESAQHPGAGLSNMAERVAAVRGTLTVDSAAGRGVQVRGRIPLVAPV